MPNVAATLKKVLRELHAERARLERQIGAVETALSGLGEKAGRRAAKTVKAAARRARKMSAAQKRAVSDRMKAYWAKRRKAAAK